MGRLDLQEVRKVDLILIRTAAVRKALITHKIFIYDMSHEHHVLWHIKSLAIRLFVLRRIQANTEETLKLHITGHCEGNQPTTDELSSQGSSTTESIPVCLTMVFWR